MAISISLSPNSLGQVVQTHGNLVPPASEALLTLGNLHSGETLLALFSLIFTALLMARKIQGSLLIGVAVTQFFPMLLAFPQCLRTSRY